LIVAFLILGVNVAWQVTEERATIPTLAHRY
jgi:hypothetical protein